jgi:lipopolysaccharide/colanic/teichoic acid biosynthesis glycosyltransferase
MVDIGVCLAVLIGGFPLLLAIAIAIRLESPGKVLFLQTRTGQDGRPFRIWKFRSMAAGNTGPLVSGAGDPRITRVGRVLRMTKLDELPQIWNILRGEMTIVGPRPEVPEMVAHYTPVEREVLSFRPGLAGPGQIVFTSEQAGELDGAEDPDALYVATLMRPRLVTDIAYFRTRTLRSDLALLRQTFALLIRASAAQLVRSRTPYDLPDEGDEQWSETVVTCTVIEVPGTVSEVA